MEHQVRDREEDEQDAKNVKLVNKLTVENVHSVKIWSNLEDLVEQNRLV